MIEDARKTNGRKAADKPASLAPPAENAGCYRFPTPTLDGCKDGHGRCWLVSVLTSKASRRGYKGALPWVSGQVSVVWTPWRMAEEEEFAEFTPVCSMGSMSALKPANSLARSGAVADGQLRCVEFNSQQFNTYRPASWVNPLLIGRGCLPISRPGVVGPGGPGGCPMPHNVEFNSQQFHLVQSRSRKRNRREGLA